MQYRTRLLAAAAAGLCSPVAAQDSDLAKKLSNPVASLVSVPFQFNYDSGYGPLTAAGQC
jgi:hypothetical protein